MKQLSYWVPTNIAHRCTKSICRSDLAPGICAPLN